MAELVSNDARSFDSLPAKESGDCTDDRVDSQIDVSSRRFRLSRTYISDLSTRTSPTPLLAHERD